MYSGSDSTDSQNLTPWAFNPTAYQNMSNDQVDWAALAQQWIIMKEAGPPPMPDPHKQTKGKREHLKEGGEAPMDVENDKESKEATASWNNVDVNQPQPPGVESWGWNSQPSWGWSNTWNPPPGGCPPPPNIKPPLLPTPGNYSQYTTAGDGATDNATFGGYNAVPPNDYQQGYWTSPPANNTPKQINIKPHNRKYSKVNVHTVERVVAPAAVPATTIPPTLDAAKRKALPAWIREGLEKMERDKLKQMEKEKLKQEKEEGRDKIKLNEKETMEILKSTIQERRRSKFESDDESDHEVVQSRRHRTPTPEPATPLTHDELMLKVRRTMTEILLKVTNREIESVCREELQRHLKKSKASDQRVSAPSGANVSARLGLGDYGGDSESSDQSDEDSQPDRRDSDSDLKESIRRKKADFIHTERDIEGRLAQVEKKKSGNDSRSSSPDTNDIDSQVDAKYQGHRSRSTASPDRTPQHSRSYKEEKYSKVSSSNSEDSDSDYERSNKHRSTSSDSAESHTRSKRRSETPDRSYRSHKDKIVSSSRRSYSKSPVRRKRSRSDSRSRRDSGSSKNRNYRRSRSSSYSRSHRSRSPSYKRSKRSSSRSKSRRSRSRSRDRRSDSRGAYSKSRRSSSVTRRSHRRRSRSSSSTRSNRRSHRR